jgi:glycosyltransferase involved in cell wall biosynthesis
LLNYKIVFKFPGQFLLDSNRNLDKIVWFFLLKFIDLFVVLENDTRRKLSQRGIVPNKIFFVSNGVEINSPIKVDRRINKPIRLVFVGRLSPEKLCDQLIKACSILLKNGVSFRLDIIGDGPLREDLIFLTKELKLENFISINGFSSDIICCMEKSDILILPSKSEGMSNVLLEAISVGLPIVCTDVGSASIQLGGFGRQFLCKPYSPDCLAKKVQILASDYELRKSYSCSLYRRGIEMFSMDSVAKNYINQYEYLDC